MFSERFIYAAMNLCVDSLSDLNSTMADGNSTVCCIDIDMDSVGNSPAPFHPETHRNQTQATLTPAIILSTSGEYSYSMGKKRKELTSLNFVTAAFLLSTSAESYNSAINMLT